MLLKFSIFLIKNGRFQECSKILNQILQTDDQSLTAFYLLAYLMAEKGEFEAAISCFRILIKMQPNNLEFWILLMMIYLKTDEQTGVDYCSLNINSKKFMNNSFQDTKSLLLLEVETEDDLDKIVKHQLTHGLNLFFEITKEFMLMQSKNCREPFVEFQLKILEMTLSGKIEDFGEILKTVELTDENEVVIRICKGNWLYSTGNIWEAICEYEIAFNACLKVHIEFPHLLTIRCGDWFIKAGVLNKARRYFHHACRKSATHSAWTGLGTICFREKNFHEAEKYFNEANKIDNKSGDNWIYLALCNFYLNRQSSFEKCFQIARKFLVQNTELMETAERLLDF